MKLKFILGVLPALVFYVDSLGEWKAGEARGPFVRILKSHAADAGLLRHELEHVRQWYLGLIVFAAAALAASVKGLDAFVPVLAAVGVAAHGVLYTMFAWYRLRSEVAAYRAQLAAYPDDRSAPLAVILSERYGLGISVGDASRLLTRG